MNLPTHRGGLCSQCYGPGTDIDLCEHESHDVYADADEECPYCPKCSRCEGDGLARWDWYPEHNDCVCSECSVWGVETMGYGEDGEEGQVCLACYLAWHARECGCDAWPKEPTP